MMSTSERTSRENASAAAAADSAPNSESAVVTGAGAEGEGEAGAEETSPPPGCCFVAVPTSPRLAVVTASTEGSKVLNSAARGRDAEDEDGAISTLGGDSGGGCWRSGEFSSSEEEEEKDAAAAATKGGIAYATPETVPMEERVPDSCVADAGAEPRIDGAEEVVSPADVLSLPGSEEGAEAAAAAPAEEEGAAVRVGALHVPGPGAMTGDVIDRPSGAAPLGRGAEGTATAPPSGGGQYDGATVISAHVVGSIDGRQRRLLQEYFRGLVASAPLVEGRVARGEGEGQKSAMCRPRKSLWLVVAIAVTAVVAGVLLGTLIPPPAPTDRIRTITESISGADAFIDTSTPQSRARHWLRYEDAYSPPLPRTDDEIGQRYVLAVLYFALGGEGWEVSNNFLGGTSECDDWSGVACKAHSTMGVRVVSEVRLGGIGLAGTLPDEVTQLPMLEVLDLEAKYVEDADNTGTGNVAGTIPPNIGALVRLKELTLGFNDISGSLPASIGNLTRLTRLTLNNNPLTGTIPSEIGNLVMLKTLFLGWSHEGEIRQRNKLRGTIPSSIGRLKSLIWLSLSFSDLTGSIPSELGNLANLESLYLYWNSLSGPIASTIGNLQRLRVLNLQGASGISGTIPPGIGNMTSLTELSMGVNDLSGTIPPSICSLTKLRKLSLYRNRLSGKIPSSVGTLSKLRLLDLAYNDLSGPIPSSIGHLTDLEELALESNQLSGTIPSSLGNLTSLEELYLHRNNLQGDNARLDMFAARNAPVVEFDSRLQWLSSRGVVLML